MDGKVYFLNPDGSLKAEFDAGRAILSDLSVMKRNGKEIVLVGDTGREVPQIAVVRRAYGDGFHPGGGALSGGPRAGGSWWLRYRIAIRR